jgi:hypothetical protein
VISGGTSRKVRNVPILLQKWKIERRQKSRESRFPDSSTAETLCIADARNEDLTSPYTKRISSPGKFRSSPQKDFCNNIGQLPTSLDCLIIQIMTTRLRYLTHPQVKIDPAVPVASWGLSDVGRTHTETLAATAWLSGTTQIISSGERKAIETAEIIGGELNVTIEVREAMHENDRQPQAFCHLMSLRRWPISFSHNPS